jgi:uncharacterized protein involved in tolerance to divalent cations
MDNITISKKDLKLLIKESIKKVLEQEVMKLRAFMLPYVSKIDFSEDYLKFLKKNAVRED